MLEVIEGSNGDKGNLTARKDAMLGFYTRPTIPVELECESPGYRKALAKEIEETALLIEG